MRWATLEKKLSHFPNMITALWRWWGHLEPDCTVMIEQWRDMAFSPESDAQLSVLMFHQFELSKIALTIFRNSFCWPMLYLLIRRGRDLWPILQWATRGQVRHFGFVLGPTLSNIIYSQRSDGTNQTMMTCQSPTELVWTTSRHVKMLTEYCTITELTHYNLKIHTCKAFD